MSRATAPPDLDGVRADFFARLGALPFTALLYSLYPVAVCVAIGAGRPRWALAATCAALGIAGLSLPRWRVAAIVLLLAVPAVLLVSAAEFAQPLVYIPPVALNLGLAAVFARTLRPGSEPLISMFARLERGVLEPDLARYTRTLTGVWVGFFVGSAALSAWLAAVAPAAVWGAFTAVGNHVAVAALFLGEYVFRRWRFPQYRHASPVALAVIVATRWRAPLTRP